MQTINMVPDDTSKHDVNYIRSVITEEHFNDYFDFVKERNEEYDETVFEKDAISISHTNCKANHGDTVYVMFGIDRVMKDHIMILVCFNDPLKAIIEVLNDWKISESRKAKIIEIKIETNMTIIKATDDNHGMYKINDLFSGTHDKSQIILSLERKDETDKGTIEIEPEFGRNEKVKSLLLSIGAINKFKL